MLLDRLEDEAAARVEDDLDEATMLLDRVEDEATARVEDD
jgi:hypothetical protein